LTPASAASASLLKGLNPGAPAAANAAAAALAFRKSRLESPIFFLPCLKVVKHEVPA
jgi:hypothetical protein